MGGMNPPAGSGIQGAIAGLKAKLGGGRQPVRGIPTGGMVAGPDGRLPINSMPPLALGGAPSGVRGGPPVNNVGMGPAAVSGAGPTAWGGGTASTAPAVPSQFDRDAAATGMWRGAARFGKPVTPTGMPPGTSPGYDPGGVPAGAGPGPVGGPPVGIFPPQGGGMQSSPQDVGQNQVNGGAPLGYAPSGATSPALQAQIAKQQQLKAGYGALLQGALKQNPLMAT